MMTTPIPTLEVKFTIDGQQYEVTRLNTRSVFAMGERFTKLLGSGLGGLSSKGTTDAKAILDADVFEVAGRIISQLSMEDFDYVCKTFADRTKYFTGEKWGNLKWPEVFEIHFQDRYSALLLFVAECIKINFASFLDGKLSAVFPQLGLIKKGLPSPE